MNADGQVVSRHRIISVIFLTLNRLILTALLLALLFGSLILIGQMGPVALRTTIAEADALWWVFSPLLTAIVTAVTLVVSVNQLVLSQELGALGDQEARMENALAFRASLEDVIEDKVGPAAPNEFLATILTRIAAVAGMIHSSVDTGQSSQQERFDAIESEAIAAAGAVEDSSFGGFSLIHASLQFEYARWLYELEALSETDTIDSEEIEDLRFLLERYGIAREHFKTLYFQAELVVLSRRMLISAFPALVVTFGMLLTVDAESISGSILGFDWIVLLVAAAFTIAVLPFALLTVYVLRIATVAKQTLSIGPFLLHEQQ